MVYHKIHKSEFVIISRLYYESLRLETEITQLSSSHVEY